MSMILDNASPIERHGHKWKPWTREQLAHLASSLPLPEHTRLLLGLNFMVAYVSGLHGVDASLAVAGGVSPLKVAELIPSLRDRVQLADDLMARALGDAASSGESEGESDPLPQTPSTGD